MATYRITWNHVKAVVSNPAGVLQARNAKKALDTSIKAYEAKGWSCQWTREGGPQHASAYLKQTGRKPIMLYANLDCSLV